MLVLSKMHFKSILIGSLAIALSYNSYAMEYPKSLEERNQDKMGSVLGNDEIQLNINKVEHTPIKTPNRTTPKEDTNYIWLAALENIKYMPLNSADYKGGIIITDWVNDDNRSTQRFKISIYIKDKAISLDSFEINIYGEEFKRGRWIANRNKHEFLKTKMTNDILLLAKELQSKGKKK
jgi:Domain of unknown function (DUF3576)